MDFVNATQCEAGWTMGFDHDARELLIVAIKATFSIPKTGEDVKFAEEQVPLTEADEFTGEPGLSAPVYETDFAHRKPHCDVLLNACAYGPRGKKCERVTVSATVGAMSKTFDVVGHRVWKQGVLGYAPDSPEPFRRMRISYDTAFGGVDDSHPDEAKLRTFLENPVGCGYHPHQREVEGQAVPNTEEKGKPIKKLGDEYVPMSFGVVGRNWQPRVAHAGTYDQAWLDQQAPFWPNDFDYRHFQAAPPDQQIPYPQGGEAVTLLNLSPQGSVKFQLPALRMPILFIPHKGEDKQVDAVIDTVLIEPEDSRFTMTWRASLPMRRSCFDVKQTIAGEMPRAWHRARTSGAKRRFKDLDALIRATRRAP